MDQSMSVEQGAQIKSPEHIQREVGLRSYITHRVLGKNPTSDLDLSASFIELNPREKADVLYEKLMAYTATTAFIKEERKQDPEVEPEPVDPYLIAEIKTLWTDPRTQEVFVSRFAEARVDAKMERLSDLGKNWRQVNEAIATTRQAFEAETRRLFLKQVPRPDQESATRGRAEGLSATLTKLREQRENIIHLKGLDHTPENTDMTASIMGERLGMYYDQVEQGGFAWLGSREEIHRLTVAGLQNGRWPVLRGEAGTGKSEQADAAALVLTGEQPTHLACGPNTGYKEMIADKEIDPVTGGSYDDYKAAMQAATGYEDSRETRPKFNSGRIVRFDESGRLGPKGYSDIKELRQKKPATRIDLARLERGESIDPDRLMHDKPVLPGFGAIFTTNPSGSRYPDRTEPDAALRRELAYINVDYPPNTPDNPELYEFMLATLMTANKHIPVAQRELAPAYTEEKYSTPIKLKDGRIAVAQDTLVSDATNRNHGVLYRLSFAIRSLQDAYNLGNATEIPQEVLRYTIDNEGKIQITESGEPLTLISSTITLGEVASWMSGFHGRKLKDDPSYQVNTLTEWLKLKLNNYLNQADEVDREKIKALFEHYHLFDGPPELKEAQPMTPKEIGYLSPRVPRPLHVRQPVNDAESQAAAPMASQEMNKDITCVLEDGTSVLARPEGFAMARPGGTPIDIRSGSRFTIDGMRYQYIGITGPQGHEQIVARIDTGKADEALHKLFFLGELQTDAEFPTIDHERIKEIFGEKFFGPDQIKETWDIDLSSQEILDISDYLAERGMTEEQLERAATLGFRLVLRADTAADGSPLTMEKMQKDRQKKFTDNKKGEILYTKDPYDWYIKAPPEPFFAQETPEFKWALVSDGVIPETPNKNYLEQTEEIINYLESTFFDGKGLPARYQEAADEFRAKKDAIAALMTNATWKQAAEQLAALTINQIIRHTPSEVIYDMIMATWKDENKRFLPDMWTWTNERTRGGRLVHVGRSGAVGASVDGRGPQNRSSSLGAALSL